MSVVAPELETAIAAAQAVVESGVGTPGSGADAVELLAAVERLRRLATACLVQALETVTRTGTFKDHAHASAHHMVRHVGRTSSADSARLDKIRRMTRDCDTIAHAWRTGGLSVDQAAVLGRAYSNPRTRAQFIAQQDRFVKLADRPFRVFERRVATWVNLADQDGPEPRPEPAHTNRDVSLVQDHFSQQWTLRGTFGSLQGAKLRRILDAYTQTETLADWEQAQADHGDAASHDLLARTDAQRRADALEQVFADALHNPDRSTPIDTTHNIVWSAESHQEMIRRYAGAPAQPIEPDTHTCHNLDGHGLDTTTAFADFLVSKWRRVVQDAQGVTIDLSTTQRFFTGLARLGVQLCFDSCYWPCDVPVTQCQIDHLRPAARGGPTTQPNGAPACRRHNLIKERGYTVTRQPDGTIRILTPNGEAIPQ